MVKPVESGKYKPLCNKVSIRKQAGWRQFKDNNRSKTTPAVDTCDEFVFGFMNVNDEKHHTEWYKTLKVKDANIQF